MKEKYKDKTKTKLKESCSLCGLPVNKGGVASITGWIFRDSHCSCSQNDSIENNIEVNAVKLDDNYEVIEEIGSGGMGTVYKVLDKRLDKVFALKVLREELAKDPAAIRRFMNEIELAKKLSHSSLVSVYDSGVTSDGQPFFVSDFVEGQSLESFLKEEEISIERLFGIILQICDALEYAHENGIVHRDLKPSNILLVDTDDDTDFVKLVDFGIAKIAPSPGKDTMSLTKTGEIFGSPKYMSPEQCQGKIVDGRSDIYSLGCLMYEAIVGKAPFDFPNPVKIILAHIYDNPITMKLANPSRDISDELQAVVTACLNKEPDERYQNISSLKKDIEAIADGKRANLPEKIRKAKLLRRLKFGFLKYFPWTIALLVCTVIGFGVRDTMLVVDELQNLITGKVPKVVSKDNFNYPFYSGFSGGFALMFGLDDLARERASEASTIFKERKDWKDYLYTEGVVMTLDFTNGRKDQALKSKQNILDQYINADKSAPIKGFNVMGFWHLPPGDPEDVFLAVGDCLESYGGSSQTYNFYSAILENLDSTTVPYEDVSKMRFKQLFALYRTGDIDNAKKLFKNYTRKEDKANIYESGDMDELIRQCLISKDYNAVESIYARYAKAGTSRPGVFLPYGLTQLKISQNGKSKFRNIIESNLKDEDEFWRATNSLNSFLFKNGEYQLLDDLNDSISTIKKVSMPERYLVDRVEFLRYQGRSEESKQLLDKIWLLRAKGGTKEFERELFRELLIARQYERANRMFDNVAKVNDSDYTNTVEQCRVAIKAIMNDKEFAQKHYLEKLDEKKRKYQSIDDVYALVSLSNLRQNDIKARKKLLLQADKEIDEYKYDFYKVKLMKYYIAGKLSEIFIAEGKVDEAKNILLKVDTYRGALTRIKKIDLYERCSEVLTKAGDFEKAAEFKLRADNLKSNYPEQEMFLARAWDLFENIKVCDFEGLEETSSD